MTLGNNLHKLRKPPFALLARIWQSIHKKQLQAKWLKLSAKTPSLEVEQIENYNIQIHLSEESK